MYEPTCVWVRISAQFCVFLATVQVVLKPGVATVGAWVTVAMPVVVRTTADAGPTRKTTRIADIARVRALVTAPRGWRRRVVIAGPQFSGGTKQWRRPFASV